MDDSCIFCRIVKGEIPASVVYDDADVLAFMDIRPIRPGHLLVIPKRHLSSIYDLDDDLYSKLMLRVKQLMLAVKEASGASRVGLMVIGLEVPHAHVHVVPLQGPNDITSPAMLDNTLTAATPEELQEMAARIKAAGTESAT